jgi:hypothetical protein
VSLVESSKAKAGGANRCGFDKLSRRYTEILVNTFTVTNYEQLIVNNEICHAPTFTIHKLINILNYSLPSPQPSPFGKGSQTDPLSLWRRVRVGVGGKNYVPLTNPQFTIHY